MDISEKPISNVIYIDTSALRAMSFHKDIACLMSKSISNQIDLYMHETAIWERGRQQYENDFDQDRLIPYNSPLNKYLGWFKELFVRHGVKILNTEEKHIDHSESLIRDESMYFKDDDGNDKRDALILSACELCLDKSIIVLCMDKNLRKAFSARGFSNVRHDVKEYIQEISGGNESFPLLDKPDLDDVDQHSMVTTFTPVFQKYIGTTDRLFNEYLVSLPTVTDKLDAKLENMKLVDIAIRKRILGYVKWFSPISKSDLISLLLPFKYQEEEINGNAQRLKQENLLIETENHWLISESTEESIIIAEQAMAVYTAEILERLELL